MAYPIVTIVATTYFPDGEIGDKRRNIARRAITSWEEYLYYSGKIVLCISDDGSSEELEVNWESQMRTRQNRMGYGASLNAGFKKAFEISPIVLHAVDDWCLIEELHLDPWVRMLERRDDIGMIRLGMPHRNLRGEVQEDLDGWYLDLERYGFAFAFRPALYHKRLIDAYGWFAENTNALECERIYNEHYANLIGPKVVLGLPHPWWHIGKESLSSLEPSDKFTQEKL